MDPHDEVSRVKDLNGPDSSRFLRALARQPVDRTPVWIMRQAGRYLPEYRETRRRAGSFLNLCTTPELACEVTLQPLARFDLDAAILFSDILTVPGAMGLGLDFVEGEGPRFARPVRNRDDIRALGVPDPEIELRYVMDVVSSAANSTRRYLSSDSPVDPGHLHGGRRIQHTASRALDGWDVRHPTPRGSASAQISSFGLPGSPGAGGCLGFQVDRNGPGEQVQELMRRIAVAVEQAFDVAEGGAGSAFHHVGGQGPRAAGESDERHASRRVRGG